MMVNNSNNINKTDNYLSSHIFEYCLLLLLLLLKIILTRFTFVLSFISAFIIILKNHVDIKHVPIQYNYTIDNTLETIIQSKSLYHQHVRVTNMSLILVDWQKPQKTI